MTLLPALLLAAVHAAPGPVTLAPCDVPGLAPGSVKCGTYRVFEDRAARAGRTIDLRIVVLPATGAERAADPVFVLAGGPGDAATRLASGLAQEWAAILRHHDVVLVDQRGTGGSHALECDLYGPDLQAALGDFFPPAAVRACRERLEKEADLARYTTADFVDDLDEVRAALGYAQVDLWGGSYGTRAALVYLRRHAGSVRAAILQGVEPPAHPAPLAFARDAQRALDGVIAECGRDAACAAAFPSLGKEVEQVLGALERSPASVTIVHPKTGDPVTVRLSRDLAAEALRYLLYEASSASQVPVVVHQAAQGDLTPLAEFALFDRREIVNSLGTGLYLSVTCAEDVPFIAPGAGEKAAEGTFLRDYRLRQQRAACAVWPRAPVVRSTFQAPVKAPTPVLLLSGEWDPVTPPAQGAEAAATLPASRHVVVPSGGHSFDGLAGTACLDGLMQRFLETADAQALDVSCVAQVHRTAFPTAPLALKPVELPEADLARLVGRYQADGSPLQATVARAGRHLSVSLPGNRTYLLVAVGPDRFRIPGALGLEVRFAVAAGRVKGMELRQGEAVVVAMSPAAASPEPRP